MLIGVPAGHRAHDAGTTSGGTEKIALMKKFYDILTRIWIVIATIFIIIATALAIAGLHVFKFFWMMFGRRQKRAR